MKSRKLYHANTAEIFRKFYILGDENAFDKLFSAILNFFLLAQSEISILMYLCIKPDIYSWNENRFCAVLPKFAQKHNITDSVTITYMNKNILFIVKILFCFLQIPSAGSGIRAACHSLSPGSWPGEGDETLQWGRFGSWNKLQR